MRIIDDSVTPCPLLYKIMAIVAFVFCGVSLLLFGLRLWEMLTADDAEIIEYTGMIGNILTAMGAGIAGFVLLQRLKHTA
jgi:hypothetical protein